MALVSEHWSTQSFWAASSQTCTEWTTKARNGRRELVNTVCVIVEHMSSLLLSIGECPSTRSFLQGISP